MQDVIPNIDVKQYGGKKKTGTEHMIVVLMDRVLALLDSNNTKSAVLMAAADWAAAFDRGDPTKTTQKFIFFEFEVVCGSTTYKIYEWTNHVTEI